jgi:tRNA(Arg) A34 adenosine deaminase TadA
MIGHKNAHRAREDFIVPPSPERETFMRLALEQPHAGAAAGEVPVGAVLVAAESGEVLARAHNRVEAEADPSAHAELLVIREVARRRGEKRLVDCDLYVTLEPCTMCAAAISFARLRRLCFGAEDPKGGAVVHGARFYAQATCHHRPEVIAGVLQEPCGEVLRAFFRARRSSVGSESRR